MTQCTGYYDDGIADGNLTRCSVNAGCGLERCLSEVDRRRREEQSVRADKHLEYDAEQKLVEEKNMGHYDSCYEYDAEQKKKLVEEKNMTVEEEKGRLEAERLSRTKLGFEIELTISGDDLSDMLRACVRQLLEKHGLSKSVSHILDDMKLQINQRGAYVEVKDPIRFTNKKY